ncbi:MAG: oligosaccharide flippase family protein [Thermoguttaceae bacterium]
MFQSRTAKVLILSSGQALTALVGVVSMAVLTRVFDQRDYGTYRQTLLAYTFAVPFITLGLDRALYFFLPGEEKRPRGLLVENLLLLTLAGGILSLFIALGGNLLLARRFNNPDLGPILLWLIPYPLLMLPASSFNACLMARNRTEQVAGFSIGSRLVMLVFVLTPVVFWATPTAAIGGTVAGAGVTTAAALFLMFHACNVGPWRPTWNGLWKQFAFSVPLGLAALVGSVSLSLDQMLVSLRCTPDVFAVYSVGAMEIPLIGMITGSITSVVMVDYAKFYRESRISDIVALIHTAMTKSALLLLPIMFFLLGVAPDMMCFLFGEDYRGAAAPFRVFLLLLPMRAITFGAVLQAAGKSHHILISSILTLVANAVLGWLAIGWIGPVGTAMASVISIYFLCVPYLIYAICSTLHFPWRKLFPWWELAKLTMATAFSGLVTWTVVMFFPGPHLLRLAVYGIVYFPLTLVILLLMGFTDYTKMLGQLQESIRGKIWHRKANQT